MKRCVIVGGAPIGDPQRIISYLRPDDYVIYCDSGLKHREMLKKQPDMIVGDFDSYDKNEIYITDPESLNPKTLIEGELIELCPVKDDTDTGHAVTVALERGFSDFLFIGMTGRRMDHTLGNLYMLHRLDELNKNALMVDDYCEMRIVSREPVYIDDSLPFFSLINITGKAKGVCIENAKYPLKDAVIEQTKNDLGISNEVLKGQTAKISVREGKLLLLRDFTG